MKLNHLEILDLISNFYKKQSRLPNEKEWSQVGSDVTYQEMLELFGGKKGLKRKLKFHSNKRVWNLEKLREGFNSYFLENGRYPTAPEIDAYPLLPSSRQIQRTFKGGLKELRNYLGLEISNYTTGAYRAKAALRYVKDALGSESRVRTLLDARFGEICVHEEKKYGKSKNTVDFFVYAKEINFGVEVFNTDSYQNMSKNLNIKLDKFKHFPFKVFFVVLGKVFEQDKIDLLVSRKTNKPLSDTMRCVNIGTLEEECLKIEPLDIQIEYLKANKN